jgi:hypothetical protein
MMLVRGSRRDVCLWHFGDIDAARLPPVALDRIPAVAESFLISVCVLRDDAGDPFWIGQRDAQPGWRAVVEDIQRETVEPDHLSEATDYLGESRTCR